MASGNNNTLALVEDKPSGRDLDCELLLECESANNFNVEDTSEVVMDAVYLVDWPEETRDNVCESISRAIKSNDANAAPVIYLVTSENDSKDESTDVIVDYEVDNFQEELYRENDKGCESQTIPVIDLVGESDSKDDSRDVIFDCEVLQEEQNIDNDNVCGSQNIPILDLYYDAEKDFHSENDNNKINNELELVKVQNAKDHERETASNFSRNNDIHTTPITDGDKDNHVKNNHNSKSNRRKHNDSGLLEGQGDSELASINQNIHNKDSDIQIDDFESMLEEQIMLNYIKKLERNLPNYRPKSAQSTVSQDTTPVNSEFIDETESILNFGDEDIHDKIRKYRERYQIISKALTVNVVMQTDLNTFHDYLNKRLIDNKNKQEKIKQEIKTLQETGKGVKELRIKTYKKFGMPYFKDSKMFFCPHNKDYNHMQLSDQTLSLNLNYSRKWRLKDKSQLEIGVKTILIEEETAEWCAEEARLKKEIDDFHDVEEKQEIRSKLQVLRMKIDAANSKNIKALCLLKPPGVYFPWERVSSDFVLYHSPVECERMWHIYVKPSINKKKWTNSEDIRLLQLADEQKFENWDTIAKKLGTSRSGYQCYINYQTRLNKCTKTTGKWTECEDKKLSKMVSKCRIGDYIPWTKISYFFQGRSLTQLYSRWTSSLNPDLKKGRFSRQEDRMIILFVRKFGEDFAKISKILGDRTSGQLRERYLRAVRLKYQNIGRWSLEEDKLLLSLVKTYGVQSWSAISRKFITRTRTQIRQRYQAITKTISKYPGTKIEDFPRGPKAKSQLLLPTFKEEEKEPENQILSVVSKEKDFVNIENKKLMQRIKSGRKKIVKREGVDTKLISYFREAYTSNKMKQDTQFSKPESVEKTAVAMLILCRFLQTHIHETKLENRSLKKLPVTLRNVITKMKEILQQWGCDCLTTTPSEPSNVCVCLQYNSIDCLPNKRKSTMIENDSFMLSSLPEYKNASVDNNNWECTCVKSEIKHILPYYLPPNLISAIGLRSVILMKDKITFALSYDRRRVGYFENLDLDIKSHGLKKFKGFFNDESVSNSDEDSTEESDVSLELNNLNSKNNADSINQVTSLPSTSQINPTVSNPETSCRNESENNISPLVNDTSDSHKNEAMKRLTCQDAINLWKERLLAILAWPIILSNQSAESRSGNANVEMTNGYNLNNVQTMDNNSVYSRKRKTVTQASVKKVRILETNEVLKTVPIIVKEQRKAFHLFEDPLSDDDYVDKDGFVEKGNKSESEENDLKCNKTVKGYNIKKKRCMVSKMASGDVRLSEPVNSKLSTPAPVNYYVLKKVTKFYERKKHTKSIF